MSADCTPKIVACLAYEKRGLDRRQGSAQLPDHGIAAAGSQEVEALGEGVGRAGHLENHVGSEPARQLTDTGQARLCGGQLVHQT